MKTQIILLLSFWTPSYFSQSGEKNIVQSATTAYGLDVSFPIQNSVSTNYPELPHNLDSSLPVPKKYQGMPIQSLGDRQKVYRDHIHGCRDASQKNPYRCDQYEHFRMVMNQRQPQSIVNMTEVGFKKVRAPPHLTELVNEFWLSNKNKLDNLVEENWESGNSFFNYWNNPTKVLSVDDKGLRGSGYKLKEAIWASLSAVMEEWTHQELQPSSLYGIRVYEEGSVLLPHVDRLPLIASAILNVAQDVDEPWPTEIYDHQGRAHNVTINPGEMLLFESASCIHGHPFPLKGKYYASMFIHFEPTGREVAMNDDGYYYLRKNTKPVSLRENTQKVDREYREHNKNGHGGHTSSLDGRLPPYIKRESPEEANWLQSHPEGWIPVSCRFWKGSISAGANQNVLHPSPIISRKPEEILPLEAHIAAIKRSTLFTKGGESFLFYLFLSYVIEKFLCRLDHLG